MRSNLRRARERAVLKQAELATKAQIDETTLGQIERGAHRPRPTTRRAILKALGAPLEAAEELFALDSGEA